MWPSVDPSEIGWLAQVCQARGIKAFLWFPVLSDQPGPWLPADSLVTNCMGVRGQGTAGAWEGLAQGDEHFLFSCPNDERSLEITFRAFESQIESAELDGIMLDKIRLPSPSNGFEALLSCFCDSCCSLFQRETGQSMGRLRDRASAFLTQLREKGAQGFCAAWAETGSAWKAAGLEELAAFRVRSVTGAARPFISCARSHGLEVGLDLFSPSLAPLVGQDYMTLSHLCDWIKPMTYCHAVGPAGLPLEIASLRRGLVALCPRCDPAPTYRELDRVFPWSIPATDAKLLQHGLSESVLSSELAAIGRLGLRSGTRVYAGVEAVRIPRFGIDINADVLRRTLGAVGAPAAGIVASWNLLQIPRENLAVLGAWKG